MSRFFWKKKKLDTLVRIFRNFQFYYRFTIIYRTICDCPWATKEIPICICVNTTVEGHWKIEILVEVFIAENIQIIRLYSEL